MDAPEVNRHVEGAATAHQQLLGRLAPLENAGLTDDMVERQSLLPIWTVGHVLAHLARHADSLTLIFRAAESGQVIDQYAGGLRQRASDIERDAVRPAIIQIGDIRRSIYEMEGAWASARQAWNGQCKMASGDLVSVSELPMRRWREVEVHMGDMGLSELGCNGLYSWSDEYIRTDLRRMTMQWKARGAMGLNNLPKEIRALDDRLRLGWLLGRKVVDGLSPADLMR